MTLRQAAAQQRSAWTLTFRAEGDGPPVELRVRRLLKAALRCHGLRCIDVSQAAAHAAYREGREPAPHAPERVGRGGAAREARPGAADALAGPGTRATGLVHEAAAQRTTSREDRP